MTLLWLLSIAGVGFLLYLRRQGGHEEVRAAWDVVLTPKGRRLLDSVASEVQTDAALLNDAREKARALRPSDPAEALRLLTLACWVVEDAVPKRLERLKTMARCARMILALQPLAPMHPADFRLAHVRSLAAAVAVVHRVLLTAASRFRLHLMFLGAGFRLVLRIMVGSVGRAQAWPGQASSWETFTAASEDFERLDSAHLEALRTLLEGLVARQRAWLTEAARAQ